METLVTIISNKYVLAASLCAAIFFYMLYRQFRRAFKNIDEEVKKNGVVATGKVVRFSTRSKAGKKGIILINFEVLFTTVDGESVLTNKEAFIPLSQLSEYHAQKNISIKYLRENPKKIIILDMRGEITWS